MYFFNRIYTELLSRLVRIVGIEPTQKELPFFGFPLTNIFSYLLVFPSRQTVFPVCQSSIRLSYKEKGGTTNVSLYLVGVKGFEPSRYYYQRILSPVRLPDYAIPPYLIGVVGLEPTRISATDFESAPSANSSIHPYCSSFRAVKLSFQFVI